MGQEILFGVTVEVVKVKENCTTDYNEGYLQCPDHGKSYTCRGAVIFRLKIERKIF